jgi:hypothetical protein
VEEEHPELWERGPLVSIQGERLDLQPVPEEDLPLRAWEKMRAVFDGTMNQGS